MNGIQQRPKSGTCVAASSLAMLHMLMFENQKAREVDMTRKILTVALSVILIAGVAFATPQAQTSTTAETKSLHSPNADQKLDKIAMKIDKDAQKFGDQAAFEALSKRSNIP